VYSRLSTEEHAFEGGCPTDLAFADRENATIESAVKQIRIAGLKKASIGGVELHSICIFKMVLPMKKGGATIAVPSFAQRLFPSSFLSRV
jgi:hypothetical protein